MNFQDSKFSFRRTEIDFTLRDWYHALMIAGIRRGNGKYNPRQMYQGLTNLSRKSARGLNHEKKS